MNTDPALLHGGSYELNLLSTRTFFDSWPVHEANSLGGRALASGGSKGRNRQLSASRSDEGR
jgi:hypothetical protein